MPRTERFFLGIFGPVCLIILPHLRFTDLDLGANLHAYQLELFNLLLQLGTILLKREPLAGQG